MKHSQNIDELITAVLSGAAQEKEIKELNHWLDQSDENRHQFEYLKKIWRERSAEPKFIHADELADKIWNTAVEKGYDSKIRYASKSNNLITQLLKVAAIIAFPTIVALYFFIKKDEPQAQISQVEEHDIIIKENPAGQKLKIILSDGSVVWLNSSSSISYSDYFSDTSRVIELNGEAYFEVKKDSLRPFIVKSGNIHTTALGTSFNVRANPEEDNIQVGLITGKVNVKDAEHDKSIILYPGRGAVYNKTKKNLVEVNIDTENVVAWKEGILIFDGENFTEFVQQLEKWYGVKINVLGTPPTDWRIRGRFDNEYLTNILQSISFNKEFNYEVNKKDVKLMFN